MRRPLFIFVSLFGVGFIIPLLLLMNPSWTPAPETLGLEFAKALLQMSIVSGIGAVVSLLMFEYQQKRTRLDSLLMFEYQQERKRLEYDEDLLKATLGKAMESYNTAKKARHLLRARARTVKSDSKEWLVSGPDYDSYMAMVIDAQLQLDNLARDVETNSRLFKRHDKLANTLRSMEAYLSGLIHEYDDKRPTSQREIPLTALQQLSDFLRPHGETQYDKKVVIPFRDVQKYIRGDLSHLLGAPTKFEADATTSETASLTASATFDRLE
jgi:hypothetical protein